MCGITGFCDFNNRSSEMILQKMTDSMVSRGPDDSGFKIWNNQNFQIGFGHRRLSILDLSANGHQPMYDVAGNYAIVLNGEIYNFKEIKLELEGYGISFNSNSDTEVVLYSFIKWGSECVKHFIGMFSFAIYDIKEEEIYLFRDRAGVKPLYYSFKNDCLLFGSELKALHGHPVFENEIDMNSVAQFLQKSWIPAPYSIYKNTFKVKPGHYIKFSIKKKSLEEIKYWDIFDYYNKPQLKIDLNDAIVETENLLKSSCEYRMVSDVPVGVFLSGGYDSSAVAALLQNGRTDKIKTFTIGFKEAKFNEAEYAKKVAAYLGTDHTEEFCSYNEAIELIDRIPFFYDEPFGDSSAIPTMLVSKIARKKVSVSLSADGGDEIFAGYTRYHHQIDSFLRIANIPWPINTILSSPIAVADLIAGKNHKYALQYKLEKLRKVLQTRNRNRRIGYRVQMRNFTDFEVGELLNKPFSKYHTYYDDIKLLKEDIDYVNMFMAVEFKTTLVDDMLTKVDRATMSYSLEGREPMLDHRLIEFCAQLPAEYKIRNGVQKYILKEIVHKYIPKQMMERPKMGFGIPVGEWLNNELKGHIEEHLSEKAINKYGVLNYQVVSKMLSNFYQGKEKNPDRIWILLMLQMWLAKW